MALSLIRKTRSLDRRQLLTFGGIFVVVGVVVVVVVLAAGPFASSEPENATLTNGAQKVARAGASGGQTIKFGTAATPTPTPTPAPTATPTPAPTATPAPGVKPSATNTGYPAGQTFTNYTGGSENNTSNVTYDGVNFPAGVGGDNHYVFRGSNLVFKNCRFNMTPWIEGNNVRIENCDINGGISINNSNGVTMLRNNIHHWEDALHITADPILVKNVTFSYNFVHTPDPGCGAHSDGVQLIGIDGFTASYNNIDMGRQFNLCGDPDPLNGTFQIKTDFNNVLNRNLTITNNWLNGGGYIFRLYQCGATSRVTGNRFGRDFSFGPVDTPGSSCLVDKSGNVYDNNNAPINL